MTFAELIEVVRACEDIQFNGCTPPYLQEFIAQRLEHKLPLLANKVRDLDQKQMHRLCAYIRETQELTR
jgi:hypothetical protein